MCTLLSSTLQWWGEYAFPTHVGCPWGYYDRFKRRSFRWFHAMLATLAQEVQKWQLGSCFMMLTFGTKTIKSQSPEWQTARPTATVTKTPHWMVTPVHDWNQPMGNKVLGTKNSWFSLAEANLLKPDPLVLWGSAQPVGLGIRPEPGDLCCGVNRVPSIHGQVMQPKG